MKSEGLKGQMRQSYRTRCKKHKSKEACSSEPAFWKKKKKINKYRFEPGSVGERNKIMKDMTSVEEAIEKGAADVL